MAKSTPLSVQNQLTSRIHGYHDTAASIKKAYYDKRQVIVQDDRLSDVAKTGDLATLAAAAAEQLKATWVEQDAYVVGLKSSLEKELRGNQPTDANSVLLRRDASDRARKIDNEKDALAALQDAINDGDEVMAHAIGTRGRSNGWLNVSEAWQGAYPETAGIAEALSYVESVTSDGAYNLANSMAYAPPAA
ncbi:hypothetical protein [Microbacterium sp.]|uniref:hypothetical protein n=1 Tax=Microbacterium sp. TaxID=51671 RepID=UPI0039E5715A